MKLATFSKQILAPQFFQPFGVMLIGVEIRLNELRKARNDLRYKPVTTKQYIQTFDIIADFAKLAVFDKHPAPGDAQHRQQDDHGGKGCSHALCTAVRSEEHTSELQSRPHLVCRLLL